MSIFRTIIIKHILVLGICIGYASSLIAVTSPGHAKTNGRFGLINMQQVILTVEEGKAARSRLEKQIKSKETELLDQKKILDKMNKEWKSQAALLSESARMKKQQEFQEKFMALRNAEMTFQQEIKREEAKATQVIAVKVQKLVETMAKEKKLEMVFESNTSGLLFLKDPVDMTGDVIARFEESSKKTQPTAKKN